MRKSFKIVLAVIATLIIVLVALGAILILDLAAYTAPGTRTLTPTGTSVGNALVVYDPGWTGAATRVAEVIATDLQAKGYTVTLAGIKSAETASTAGYNIIVAGSPVYGGTPTSSVKDFLAQLNPSAVTAIGVFGSGQGTTTEQDIAMIKNGVPALQSGGVLQDAVVVKIGETEDLNARAANFVNQLVA